MKKSKWCPANIDALLAEVALARSKSAAFRSVAIKMNMRPNSVRNFYYSLIDKKYKKTPKQFTKLEVQTMLRAVILGYSRGESVRSICLSLGKTSRTAMLRFQNKYRTILAGEPHLITEMLAELESEGYLTKNPLSAVRPAAKALDNVVEMPLPLTADYNNLSDQDIQNLFMGLVRLVRKQGQSQIDKLRAEIERLKQNSKLTNRRNS